MRRAVFLDRDGTLIEEKHYLHRTEEVVLFPDARGALQRLVGAGLELFLVTNQSGVGRGYFPMGDVEEVHRHIEKLLAPAGVRFLKIYVAPEAPGEPSRGRKPSPQFLFDARDEFQVDLSRSYMIGDKLADVDCGRNAGLARSILVRTGYGSVVEQEKPEALREAIVVDNLSAAADWILELKNREP